MNKIEILNSNNDKLLYNFKNIMIDLTKVFKFPKDLKLTKLEWLKLTSSFYEEDK